MKNVRKTDWKSRALQCRVLLGVMALILSVILGIGVEQFSIVSFAQSQSKVIAKSAKIRKEASTSSEALGSVEKDDSLTINHKVTGSDGNIWYQVFVNADTLGYIRSDLVEITDGSTPPTVDSNTAATDTTTNNETSTSTANETQAEVTAVNPVSATAAAESVRVRANASTGSQIVASIQKGFALTVKGTANGTDGKVWYQVNFVSDNKEVTGFIRSDFVNLEGELTPYTEIPADGQGTETTEPEGEPEPVVETKDWDTQGDGDKWYLIDNVNQKKYEIQQFFELEKSAEELKQLYDKEHSQNKTQKMVVIILVVVLVALAAVITLLIFKMKDMKDAAYFEEVERESARRRTADRPSGAGQKAPRSGNQRPAGNVRPGGVVSGGTQRPAQGVNRGAVQGGNSAHPGNGNVRPGGTTRGESPRPAQGAGARPTQGAGARPVQGTGARPANQSKQRPGAASQGAEHKTAGHRPAANGNVRPVGEPQSGNHRPAGQGTARPAQGQRSRARNFANEDDEFEFEFLNWDGDEE